MAKIFISYASPDRDLAENLAAGLYRRGHQPFFDVQALLPGQPWQETLAKGLRDADALVLIVSPDSAQSSWIFMALRRFSCR